MMLRALVSDLVQVPGVEVITTRDARLPDPGLPAEVHYLADEQAFAAAWAGCLSAADAVWPIAPETDGILEDISRRVLQAGVTLLASPPGAVRIAASKQATAETLNRNGVPAVPVFPLDAIEHGAGQIWVVKPDDGVGCMGIRVVNAAADLERLRPEFDAQRMFVAQHFVCGTPVSLCLLCQHGGARLLSTNLQRIAVSNDEFVLLGCTVNARHVQDSGYQDLADAIAAAMPDLWGIVGVDLIVTPSGPQVLEINPRLTTSYVGLHRSLGINPARLVLELLETGALPAAFERPGLPVEVALETMYVA